MECFEVGAGKHSQVNNISTMLRERSIYIYVVFVCVLKSSNVICMKYRTVIITTALNKANKFHVDYY
jgi:hypothetical protein